MHYEYQLIRDYYGDRTAERSGIPLLNHIDEGLRILELHQATEDAAAAFCLHPLVQSEEAYRENLARLCEDDRVGNMALVLTLEYRRAANSYLCTEQTDAWGMDDIAKAVGTLSRDIRHMLIADKQQNYKDFMLAHYPRHPRSDQLYKYFHNWFNLLECYWA